MFIFGGILKNVLWVRELINIFKKMSLFELTVYYNM